MFYLHLLVLVSCEASWSWPRADLEPTTPGLRSRHLSHLVSAALKDKF